MLDDEAVQDVSQISTTIQKGEAVLFLGAGASRGAGVPLGGELGEMIKEEFPLIDQRLDNLIDVCQSVIDTPPYNRNQLEEFIADKFLAVKPSREHEELPDYDWSAIFTTNFDDLIETAYRNAESVSRRCLPVVSENFRITPGDRKNLYLFKIMGCVRVQGGEPGAMVLSRADYNRALVRRREFLKILFDFVRTGTLIFIGYSFGDRIALDVMDEVKELYGESRLPWSYALFDRVELDDRTRYLYQSRKIRPVECSFEDLFAHLRDHSTPKRTSISREREHIKIMGMTLEVDEGKIRQLSESFEVLTEEAIAQEPGQKDDFFKGINSSWGAFREGWDFTRESYGSPQGGSEGFGILERVVTELTTLEGKASKTLLIKGMPGVGKTTLLKRLAYDVYTQQGIPVILLKSLAPTLDYKTLYSFIANLGDDFIKRVPHRRQPQQIKSVIIIDDAASFAREIGRIEAYLTSRGRAVLILAAERSGEWAAQCNRSLVSLPDEDVYELDESLTGQERSRIVEHFRGLGYISNAAVSWESIIEKQFENSFFATVYRLVHPAQKPLNEIIQDQYRSLPEPAQQAFKYIACFHQFNLPINMELLVRTLKCSYQDFLDGVVKQDAAKIIFEETDTLGNVLFRTHHRIIADHTVRTFFGDPQQQTETLLEILGNANLTNEKEAEIVEKLLINHVGPGSTSSFTLEQQRRLFSTVCNRYAVRSLVHHWGILELDANNYADAEQLLTHALDLPRENAGMYRGESDQNILTSLGTLYSRMGIDELKTGDHTIAQDYFAKAENCFAKAKHGEFPNAHAYHAHAFMWFVRGNEQKEEWVRLRCYGMAIEIVALAHDNLNPDDLQIVEELATSVYTAIGDEAKVQQYADILRVQFNTPAGYRLNSQLLLRRARQTEGQRRERLIQKALDSVDIALKYFPSDEHSLRLKAVILAERKAMDLEEYFQALEHWKGVAVMPSARLLYELGRVSFLLGYYDKSAEVFRELENGPGVGHSMRSTSQHAICDETKNMKKEFDGVVVRLLNPRRGFIRCETLRSLRYNIAFNPLACDFTATEGVSVEFHIEFNFRGPLAVNVRRMA